MDINKCIDKVLSRRNFLAGAGSVAAAAALTGCADDGTVVFPPTSSPITDADILTFALNLEYLEANFYLYAATGGGLTTADMGSGAGTVTVPSTTQLTGLTSFQQNLLNELAYTEQQHVRFLRAALTAAGVTPVAQPALDFVNPFNTIASLAGLGSTFNAYASFDNFIVAATLFEDVGVTAYNGAAPLISADGIAKNYLAAAAGIMATEAYHGATGRGYLFSQAATKGSTAYPYAGYLNAIQDKVISPLSSGYGTTDLAGFGSSAITVGGVTGASATLPNIVPADSNALAYHRTTDQVLHIAYGTFSNTAGSTTPSAGVSKGGFFPAGFNGNIKTTAA